MAGTLDPGDEVVPTDLSAPLTSTEGDSIVVLPVDPADGVLFAVDSGPALSVSLPGNLTASDAVQVGDTTVVYENSAPDVSIAAQSTDSGDLRILIAIDGPTAPTSYAFPIALPEGGGVEPQSDGSIEFVGADGITFAFVKPAWAKDANGSSVATSFEVIGNTIVQHVQHVGAAYPVVADPAFQGDCGYITCTVRLDRAQTRNASDASWIITGFAAACSVLGGLTGLLCAAAIAPGAVALAVAAGRFYENGNCIGARFYLNVILPVAWPVEVRRGTYNCPPPQDPRWWV